MENAKSCAFLIWFEMPILKTIDCRRQDVATRNQDRSIFAAQKHRTNAEREFAVSFASYTKITEFGPRSCNGNGPDERMCLS